LIISFLAFAILYKKEILIYKKDNWNIRECSSGLFLFDLFECLLENFFQVQPNKKNKYSFLFQLSLMLDISSVYISTHMARSVLSNKKKPFVQYVVVKKRK
jgi:hypothetical protein